MNGEHHRGRVGKWGLAFLCAVLPAMALSAFVLMRSHSHRSDLMTLDSDGTMRLGSVPLRNTNVRDAALTVVSHLNNGTVSFSATGAVTLSNIAGTMQEMRRAGVSNLVIRSGKAAVETNAK
jgi:biopolymer transport protein ExbD